MLVLTRNEANGALVRVLAVPITRSVRDIPTHVRLDESDGMREPCALALDDTGPIAKSRLTTRITTLGPEKMGEVCGALKLATEC
jgi:mRNA-degrading endonuclease toxin of MazEF toxin-antitoxin module